ncbi:MAG: helix-turn-helix domain-containing protein [Lentisphaeria bacterium]|nr:helix-turn-helix domain-containing protein [Lentisphaeria bacterium]
MLDYLAETAEAMSVKELAEHFSLPNSHICRLLKTLTETGYVEQ